MYVTRFRVRLRFCTDSGRKNKMFAYKMLWSNTFANFAWCCDNIAACQMFGDFNI
jgi:hypothetical protein